MDNKLKTCIVSVAFRQPYLRHSKVQEETIRKSNPEIDYLCFRDQLPVKNGIETNDVVGTFQKSLYGFKPHAIQRAIDVGYKKIIWLDPSVLPTCNMNTLVDSLDEHPMIVITGDAFTKDMTNQKVKDWFCVTDNDLGETKNVGGTMYAFNFFDMRVRKAFDLWKSCEEAGMFGDQESFMRGSWADESAMSICLYKLGISQYKEKNFLYLNQKEL